MAAQRPSPEAGLRVSDVRVARVLRAIQEQPARAFTVRELAKLAGASRATFKRLFRAATGQSPRRYLAERRLAAAAELLATSEVPLAEIARVTGYASEFSLSRAFKRRHGMAPAHYRRSLTLRCAA
jgi:transcriptional regulator GlxA family with amidase domain